MRPAFRTCRPQLAWSDSTRDGTLLSTASGSRCSILTHYSRRSRPAVSCSRPWSASEGPWDRGLASDCLRGVLSSRGLGGSTVWGGRWIDRSEGCVRGGSSRRPWAAFERG